MRGRRRNFVDPVDLVIAPCAWCCEIPLRGLGKKLIIFHECELQNAVAPLEAWNETQAKIACQRKKDFEAGFARGMGESFEDYLASK